MKQVSRVTIGRSHNGRFGASGGVGSSESEQATSPLALVQTAVNPPPSPSRWDVRGKRAKSAVKGERASGNRKNLIASYCFEDKLYKIVMMKKQIQTANEVKNSSRIRTLAHETRKQTHRFFSFVFFFFVSIFFFFGCASTGFLMGKPKVTVFGDTYPQKAKDEAIDIYMTVKPSREYIEFAKITIEDTNEKWCMEQVLKKAREIGADAVVILGKGMVPIGEFSHYVVIDFGMTAVAIKYK